MDASGGGGGHLSQWPLFSLLSVDFLRGVKIVCVFGSAGNEAILVTHDDEVFALGSNCSSCLGLGDSKSSLQPRKVELLCKQEVVDIAFGSGPHLLARTSRGELYSWGHNGYGQLGLGIGITSSTGAFPQRVVSGGLEGIRVAKVACGGHHTLVLSESGEVYAWGYNNCGQIGSGNTVNQSTPRKVQGALGGVVCSSIVCGHASSIALSTSGELYGWGYNGNGQLGIGSNTNQSLPWRVNLPDVFIAQVVCGYAHTLALTDEGLLYAWGSSAYGQLGTGSKSNAVAPLQVALDLGRFTEVAAYHNNHISAAKQLSGKVYMWGMCRGQSVLQPLETKFSSLDDIFAAFASPASMWRPIVLEDDDSCGLVRCIAERFDDVNTSDLTVIVEGRKIYVHKALLRMRCEYFYSMFQQGRWSEADKDSVEIGQFPYSVYHAFLKFLYTDTVDDLNMDDIIGLLDLADSYCETALKKKCEKLIWQQISVDNVASLLAIAAKYKAETLEDYCFKFALNHMTQVVRSEAFSQLDSSLAKQFIRKAATHGAFKT